MTDELRRTIEREEAARLLAENRDLRVKVEFLEIRLREAQEEIERLRDGLTPAMSTLDPPA